LMGQSPRVAAVGRLAVEDVGGEFRDSLAISCQA